MVGSSGAGANLYNEHAVFDTYVEYRSDNPTLPNESYESIYAAKGLSSEDPDLWRPLTHGITPPTPVYHSYQEWPSSPPPSWAAPVPEPGNLVVTLAAIIFVVLFSNRRTK
jgi:hypothetical protein